MDKKWVFVAVCAMAAAVPASMGDPLQARSAAQPQARQYNLSKEERDALKPLNDAVVAKDWARATAALPAATAAARSADAKYAIGQFKLRIGLGIKDERMQADAVDTLLASGGAEASELPSLYRNQAALALRQNKPAKAEAAFARLVEIAPGDSEAIVNLAKLKAEAGKAGEAVALMDRAIGAKSAAGQAVDESWYRYALKVAYEGKLGPQALKLTRDLIAAYPTEENWRDSLLIYRDYGNLDAAGRLDLFRLMRASKALVGERDWYDYADAVNDAGLPGEVVAVLDEGASLRMVDPKKAAFADLARVARGRIAADRASLSAEAVAAMAGTAGTPALKVGDAYYGYGDYAKAAEFYGAALSKSGVDAGIARLRLGMALAQAGKRAEAATAFRAVSGPKSGLAAYWLLWLSQRR